MSGGEQKTNSEGIALVTWFTSGESDGWYEIKCNISDEEDKYYNASLAERKTFVKIERQLIIDSIEWQYNQIYRNDSFEPYNSTITVHVKDASIGSAENATVHFFNSSAKIGNCTTDSSGYCSLVFNPPDTLKPGVYTLFINATTSQPGVRNSSTNTTSYIAKGILFLEITSPSNSSQFAKSETIDLKAEVRSENNEDIPSCLLYTSPSPRDLSTSRMPSSA